MSALGQTRKLRACPLHVRFTPLEAAQLQARFLQTQMTVLGEQGKALIEPSLKVAKETADTLIKATTNAVSDLKSAAA